jgi:uncharacterized protein YaiL (DUF2058 family)
MKHFEVRKSTSKKETAIVARRIRTRLIKSVTENGIQKQLEHVSVTESKEKNNQNDSELKYELFF